MRKTVRIALAIAAGAGLMAALTHRHADAQGAAARTARSQQAYLAYCAMCHGPEGAGDGDVAVALKRSNITVPKLADAALLERVGRAGVLRVITEGGAHAGLSNIMPSWGTLLGASLAGELADYVMTLPGQTRGIPASTVEKYLKSPAGVAGEGRKLYVYHCSACHGPKGKGDGPSGIVLAKRRGVKPRDLTDSKYMARKTDKDLFAVVSLGGGHLGKSVYMPSWTVDLTPGQIKDLVAYLREISKTPAKP